MSGTAVAAEMRLPENGALASCNGQAPTTGKHRRPRSRYEDDRLGSVGHRQNLGYLGVAEIPGVGLLTRRLQVRILPPLRRRPLVLLYVLRGLLSSYVGRAM